MADEPQKPKNVSFRGLLGAAGAVIVFAAAFVLSREGTGALFGGISTYFSGRSLANATWQKRAVREVTLDSPFALGAGPDVSKTLPPEVRKLITSMETFDSGEVSSALRIQVSRTSYDPSVTPNLDGGVNGAISNVAKEVGDSTPKFSTSPLRISNLEARRASYSHTLKGKELRLEMIFVGRGQDCWAILAICTTPDAIAAAERVLKSVEIGGN